MSKNNLLRLGLSDYRTEAPILHSYISPVWEASHLTLYRLLSLNVKMSVISTPITDLFGIKHPVLLAGMVRVLRV